jgi:hypothetical protein
MLFSPVLSRGQNQALGLRVMPRFVDSVSLILNLDSQLAGDPTTMPHTSFQYLTCKFFCRPGRGPRPKSFNLNDI